MRRYIYHIILLILVFVSCEKKIVWNTKPKTINYIVVDGLLTNERKQHKVKITLPVDMLNAEPKPVSGAVVKINTGDSTVILQENMNEKGVYETPIVQAVVNKTYNLSIHYKNDNYTAEALMIPVSSFESLSYVQVPDTIDLYQIEKEFTSVEPARWEIFIDWSDVPDYENVADSLCQARLNFYNLHTIDPGQVFAPEKEKVYFPRGTKIIQTKYSLTDEHAEFIRTLLSETEWKGGFFDAAPGNVKTNLSAGARGYFAVSTVVKDTVIVE